MNTKLLTYRFFVTVFLLSSCSAGQISVPSQTPLPTATPSATETPVPIPVSLVYNPVPRWMMLAQPFYGIEILGEKWNYTNDRWGETYACMDYTREEEPYLFFEQCFAVTQPELTFESQRDAILKEDFEALTPVDTFGDVGQISLMAKRLEDNSTKFVKFFELIGFEKYILLVEMNLATEDPAPLQSIYEDQAAATIDYVLRSMLEKSRLIPRPTATPLSPAQESFYLPLAAQLITETEASDLYGGTWEALHDFVSTKRTQVCRDFEDRTNTDVYWVRFSNCVYRFESPTFEEIVGGYKQTGDVPLQSAHPYEDPFALYAFQDGHTYFYAWLHHGEYFYFVELESRTLAGQTIEELYTEEVDDFIYAVLMTNAQR